VTVILICTALIAMYACIEAIFALALSGKNGQNSSQPLNSYSIVVAARNEEKNIEQCIQSLLALEAKPECIVVVDDHSDDGTADVVKRLASRNPLITLLSCDSGETGKRAALLKGVLFSNTELILTTDADCVAGPKWASSLIAPMDSGVRLITGPVVVSGRGVLFIAEYTETLYLMSGGAGAAALGLAFQVSGANLAFYKSDFEAFVKSGTGSSFKSGDDVFFLQYLQTNYGRKSAVFNQESEAVIRTESQPSVGAWLQQRVRWMSKAAGYRRFDAFIAGMLMMSSFAACIVAAVCMIILPEFFYYGLTCVVLKMLGDFLLLVSAAVKWELRTRLISFVLFTPLYPFFLLAVGLTALLGGKQSWKGRKIT